MTGVETDAKPLFRGRLHQIGFFVVVPAGILLIAGARSPVARVAATVYAIALAGMYGTSALYHRLPWSPNGRRWMKRLDHSMIFVLIAGTYTPVALLALHGGLATAILIVVWASALGGVIFKLAWIDAPKWLFALVYVALGWVSLAVIGELPETIGWLGVAGLAAGGLLYTAGAVVYASGRPDPSPRVFGYHEVFHALVLAAAALHYAVIAFAVLPHR